MRSLISILTFLGTGALAGVLPRQDASATSSSTAFSSQSIGPTGPPSTLHTITLSETMTITALNTAPPVAGTGTGAATTISSTALSSASSAVPPSSTATSAASETASAATTGTNVPATTGTGVVATTGLSASSGSSLPPSVVTESTNVPSTSGTMTSTTSIGTGTNNLGWIATGLPSPTVLLSTNMDAINPTATGPIGSHSTAGVTFATYDNATLETFWDTYVGAVQEPPFNHTPTPPHPYPLPNAPPALYPDFYTIAPKDMLPGYKFPKDFLFGWATAAQQWEGAVKADGKGPTIWDWASRFPTFIADNTTSDVGDLGYYLYKEDIARIAALGGNVYSFSTFWTRILPFATADSPINQAGLDHYRDVIKYAMSLGVEPVVTLFHWDTPLSVQLEYGGFASDRIIDDFVNYAEIMFKAYNGTVTRWLTFNEPVVFCGQMGYPVNTTLPEGLNSTTYPFTCSYHLTLAHAKAVQRFRELKIVGEIAFKSDNFVGVPWRANNSTDQTAQQRHQAYQIGIFAEPIYDTGDWPELIKNDLPASILRRFNSSQIAMIKGSADFFAIDGYRDGYVTDVPEGVAACVANISDPLWPVCNQVNFYDSTPAAWAIGNFANFPTVPWLQTTWQDVRPFLQALVKMYPTKGGIYLSEFGFAEPFENEKNYIYQITEDSGRTAYFNSYLGEVLKGIVDDKIPIKGTFAWSLVDNFEWNSGLSTRFGVQYVDYNSPTLQRTFKRSALEMSQFWNAHRTK